jgi:hypothetical protein
MLNAVRRSRGACREWLVHPILIDLYARERHADMLRAAELRRAARERRTALSSERGTARLTPRERLGWLLVTLGLRLAVDASPSAR